MFGNAGFTLGSHAGCMRPCMKAAVRAYAAFIRSYAGCSWNHLDAYGRILNKKAVLPQGNRAMLQVFFSVEVRQQHSLQV